VIPASVVSDLSLMAAIFTECDVDERRTDARREMLSNHFLEGLGRKEETRLCALTREHSFSLEEVEEDIGKVRTFGMEVMMVCRFRDFGCCPEDRGRTEVLDVGR